MARKGQGYPCRWHNKMMMKYVEKENVFTVGGGMPVD